MKKLDTNNNVYTIIYATVMVVIVALLLAVVSSALKPIQEDNEELDRKKQVLSSLNIDIKQVKDVDALYRQVISEQEFSGKQLLVATLEDGSKKYIIPMHGAGLWGAIWGYIALNDDKNTVFGTYFNHDSETPGLGGEITTRAFQTRFIDKHIASNDGYSMEIVKGEATGEQVQAISGATITSKGVETMINTTLKEYTDFLGGEMQVAENAEEESNVSNIVAIEAKQSVEAQEVEVEELEIEEVSDPFEDIEPQDQSESINELKEN